MSELASLREMTSRRARPSCGHAAAPARAAESAAAEHRAEETLPAHDFETRLSLL